MILQPSHRDEPEHIVLASTVVCPAADATAAAAAATAFIPAALAAHKFCACIAPISPDSVLGLMTATGCPEAECGSWMAPGGK